MCEPNIEDAELHELQEARKRDTQKVKDGETFNHFFGSGFEALREAVSKADWSEVADLIGDVEQRAVDVVEQYDIAFASAENQTQ